MAGQQQHNTYEEEEESPPNEAIFFVLPYLPVYELLTMSRVCRSLRDATATDPLPWLGITVDRPLNFRLTDDALAAVTGRAQGRLHSLALISCVRITDAALLRLVAQNPAITKLHVPGCTGLTRAGIVTAVRRLTTNGHGLMSLGISGIHGIQKADLTALRSLIDTSQEGNSLFYHEYLKSSALEHRPRIDVDVCPNCDQVKMVFDCPQPLCPLKQRPWVRQCRGCNACIIRCVECGVCLTGMLDTEDSSCADALCLSCWVRLPKCSYCNKPSCTRHTAQQHNLPGSTGFLCDDCHTRYGMQE